MRQIPERRAVVLTRSVGGLLAGAWLAERGVDVRVLCVPGVGGHEHGLHRVAPEVAEWAEPYVGRLVRPGAGITERWLTPTGWRAPEVLPIGTSPAAVDALGHTKLAMDRRALVMSHLRALSGVGPDQLPTSLLRNTHGSHQELRVPLVPTAALMASLSERVRDAGGDVLEDVEVEELDVLDGRVMGVWSDHGLEHVEEVLWTDLEGRALRALGAPLAPTAHSASEELVVDLDVDDVDALPALGWLARAGVPVSRLERCALLPESGLPWTRVRVWLCCGADDARARSTSDLDAWLQAVLVPLIGSLTLVGVRSRRGLSWAEQADATPDHRDWLNSAMVALPGALPGASSGLVPVAEWLMRLEGRPPAAATGRVGL